MDFYIRTTKEKKKWQEQFVIRDKKMLKFLNKAYPDKPFAKSYQEVERKIFDKAIPQDWKTFRIG